VAGPHEVPVAAARHAELDLIAELIGNTNPAMF
jgi:hypothetical protein